MSTKYVDNKINIDVWLKYIYATCSNEKGIKSLGPMRATGKKVKDNRYVLHLTPTLQLAATFLSFEIRAWLKY